MSGNPRDMINRTTGLFLVWMLASESGRWAQPRLADVGGSIPHGTRIRDHLDAPP